MSEKPSSQSGRPSEAELFEAICSSFPDTLLIIAPNGVLREARGAGSQSFMLEPHTASGKPLSDLLERGVADRFREAIEHIATTGEPARVEFSCIEKTGVQKYEARLTQSSSGDILAFIRDITDRTLTEEALRASEQRYRAIVEDQIDMICRFLPDGTLTFVNDSYARYFRRDPDSLIGTNFYSLLPGDDVDAARRHLASFTPERPIASMEHRVQLEDGSIRWQLWTDRAFFDSDGNLLEFQSAGRDITNWKDTAEALRLSEERFREMASAIQQVFWIFHPAERRMIYVSPAYRRIWGVPPDPLLRDVYTQLDYVVPEHRQMVRQNIDRNYRQHHTLEYRIIRSEGMLRWIRERTFPRYDATGKLLSVYGVAEDVTEQKAAQENLRLSEERFQLAMEGSEAGVWDWNLATSELTVTSHWLTMLGCNPEQFVPRIEWYMERIHPDDKDTVECALKEHTEGRSQIYECEHRVRHRDGKWLWVLGRGKIVARGDDGEPLRFVGTSSDISDRKKIEHDLKWSEERLQLALEAAEDGLWDWDLVSGDVYYSARCAEMLGYTREDLSPTFDSWKRWIHPEDLGPALDALDRHLSGKSPLYETEVRMIAASGEHRWIQTRGKVVRWNEEGQPIRMAGTHKDITDRMEVEVALRRAKEAAEDAARAKADFLAVMSHEIRTPLNGIIGMANLLLETDLDQEQIEFSNTIHKSSQALLAIINDILDFSKIEAEKLEIESVSTNLYHCLEEIGDLIAPVAQDKGLEFIISMQPDVPSRVKADPGRLRQVLLNLASNAVKFTEKGDVVLEIRMAGTLQENTRLRFSVSDTGIGIPKERQKHLFSPFTQIDVSTTRRYGGTGLGLAICKRLVGLMNGTIGLESEPGTGSTFWFELPLALVPDPLNEESTARRRSLRRRRFLLIDDNPRLCASIIQHFRNWGCRYSVANSYGKAKDLLQEAINTSALYHAVIIDATVGDTDCWQIIHQLEEDFSGTILPLVLLIPLSQRIDMDRRKVVISHPVVTKPIKHASLYDLLARQPEKRSTSRTVRVPRETREPANVHANIRILIVEDNIVNQQVAELLLRKRGYATDVAANGKVALEKLTAQSYDIVLMDCMMPEMDGYQATRAIRRGAVPRSDIPIIAMTASAMEGDREKCLAAGMDDYLSKPIIPENLYHKLLVYHPGSDRSGVVPIHGTNDPATPLPYESLQTLTRITGGDRAFMREMLMMIAGDIPRQVKRLRDALTAGDYKAITRSAHSIKGHALHLDADDLKMTAHAMERAALDRNLIVCRERLARLEELAAKTVGRVRRILEEQDHEVS